MKILIIGQTTLHWGRMEYGNIGNYYIIEPFIRELHKIFPGVEIKTTLQMTDYFCQRENIARLPMELYYSWDDKDYLHKALKELGIAEIYNQTNNLVETTPYINAILEADIIIDFSGDIWGDNADFLGKNRFLIGLIKDRTAQLMKKKTVMLAGSPGPFKTKEILPFAKKVYESFDLVTNRENISTEILNNLGFNLNNTKTLSCPSFLFEPKPTINLDSIFDTLGINNNKKNIGFIICGWNLTKGPFDRWPIKDEELINYILFIEDIINNKDVNIILMSHSNGFDLPPYFKLKHGRDYLLAKRLYEIIKNRNKIDLQKLKLQNIVLDAWTVKAFIGKLDILISGRIHGAVAGLSQYIPTLIIDYGHEPKAHKLKGFAQLTGMESMIVDPNTTEQLLLKFNYIYNNTEKIKKELKLKIPKLKQLAKENFKLLKYL